MPIDDDIFCLRENLFKCITNILGNRNIVMFFSILSTALHLEHLYPQGSIFSDFMKSYKHFSTEDEEDGIYTERSIKLSKERLLYPHFQHSILLHSWPSKRSVIIELSRSLKYLNHISDCSSIGFLSQSICLYFGFLLTRFISLCMPSRRNLKNSWASCCPYPENYRATFDTCDFRSLGAIAEPRFFLPFLRRSA